MRFLFAKIFFFVSKPKPALAKGGGGALGHFTRIGAHWKKNGERGIPYYFRVFLWIQNLFLLTQKNFSRRFFKTFFFSIFF